jgi:hypothetical protein
MYTGDIHLFIVGVTQNRSAEVQVSAVRDGMAILQKKEDSLNIKDFFEEAVGGIQSTKRLSYLWVGLRIYFRDSKARTGHRTASEASRSKKRCARVF